MKSFIVQQKDVWIGISIAGLLAMAVSILGDSIPLGFGIAGIASWIGGAALYGIAKNLKNVSEEPK